MLLLRMFIVMIKLLRLCTRVSCGSQQNWGWFCVQLVIATMASLAEEASKYLQQVMCNEGKEEDELIKHWDDDKAAELPHEVYVLACGQVGAQKIMHCLTYETINLPGAPCCFELFIASG